MKKLYILLISLFTVINVDAQWIQLTSGTSVNLHSIYFTDSNTGYIVGDYGITRKTTDGGINWLYQNSGTSYHLQSIFFTDTNTGFAVGYIGSVSTVLIKTTNGGVNWINVYSDSSGNGNNLNSVFFSNKDTGYAVGNIIILKTTDGGTNWISQNPGTSNELYSVYFTSANTGYAVGYAGTILKTTDGGTNWFSQSSGVWPNTQLYSVSFPTANTGYVVGHIDFSMTSSYGYIAKTTDGGINWSFQIQNILAQHFYSVYFTDSITGYTVSDGGIILKTTNGGTNWQTQYPLIPPYYNLNCVFFSDSSTGYAIGDAGTIFKTTNGGLGINEGQSENNKLYLYPNPAYNEIELFLNSERGKGILNIYDSKGDIVKKLVGEKIYSENAVHIDIHDLSEGLYFMNIVINNKVYSTKFVKMK